MIPAGAAEADVTKEGPRPLPYYAVVGLGLAATVVVTILVTRVARRALAEATGESRRTPSPFIGASSEAGYARGPSPGTRRPSTPSAAARGLTPRAPQEDLRAGEHAVPVTPRRSGAGVRAGGGLQ